MDEERVPQEDAGGEPEAVSRDLAGLPQDRSGIPGGMGPALTTEAVGDPDASSERSAAEGGAATGAVIGAVVGGPIGLAIGAAVGGATGAAAGPEEGAARSGDERVDSRRDREEAFAEGHTSSPIGPPPEVRHDSLREPHAVDIPVVDALSGHGEADAERA